MTNISASDKQSLGQAHTHIRIWRLLGALFLKELNENLNKLSPESYRTSGLNSMLAPNGVRIRSVSTKKYNYVPFKVSSTNEMMVRESL